MQIVRTVLWIAITAILVAFIAMNWTRVPVNFWPLDDANYVHFEWPVGVVALVFFVLGMAPVWLYLRACRAFGREPFHPRTFPGILRP